MNMYDLKKTSLRMALVSICLSILGVFIAILIEEVIIGKPEFSRVPVIGMRGWFITCVLGILFGVISVKKAKRWKFAVLGLLGIFLNIVSLLFLGMQDVQVLNLENIKKRNKEEAKAKLQEQCDIEPQNDRHE